MFRNEKEFIEFIESIEEGLYEKINTNFRATYPENITPYIVFCIESSEETEVSFLQACFVWDASPGFNYWFDINEKYVEKIKTLRGRNESQPS